MHACIVESRRSWETISVLLTETNNPCVTTPVSLTAWNGVNVGGVRHCVLPPWGQWQEVSSTMTREKHIYSYRLFMSQHYIKVMGKSKVRCWKWGAGTACGIIVSVDALTQQAWCTTIKLKHTLSHLVVVSLLITPLVSCPTTVQHHLHPLGFPGLLPVSESWRALPVFHRWTFLWRPVLPICQVQRGSFRWIWLRLLTCCSTATTATLTTNTWRCYDVKGVWNLIYDNQTYLLQRHDWCFWFWS